MDTHELIDAQFDRAVQIVQGLPKTGPIQTGYEEKLAMYSLYKQATVGNVKPPRPAMWDMLGRAKWDAWAKHKDLDSYEAKWLYVDALLRVLRRYSDKTVARDLVRELEAYGGDPGNIAMSGSFSRSRGSESSSGSNSPTPSAPLFASLQLQQQLQQQQQLQLQQRMRNPQEPVTSEEEEEDETDDDNENAEAIAPLQERIAHPNQSLSQSQLTRPQSSLSTQRYRTPMGGSTVMSPPPAHQAPMSMSAQQQYPYAYPHTQSHPQGIQHVPAVQPMPAFETPSAFPGPSPPASASASSAYPHPPMYPANMYPGHPAYRPALQPSVSLGQGQGPATPGAGVRSPLERAVESVQAHLAALQERIETLEAGALVGTPFQSHSSLLSHRSPARRPSPRRLWDRDGSHALDFDLEHMGMWSYVLLPLARLTRFLLRVVNFLVHRDAGISPALVVLRRLLLDLSFILCVALLGRVGWRRSGMRRREVVSALRALWSAVVGRSTGAVERVLVERGV